MLLDRFTVSQRLLFAFAGASLMCAAIAALAIVQVQSLAAALGTPEAQAASRQAAWLVGGLAAAAAAGGVVLSLSIVRGLDAALGAEPRVLGACARRVADGDLAGVPVAGGARGVMADLARMQAQLVQLVGAVRDEAEAVHAHGGSIADDSRALEAAASAQSRALAEAALALQQEALAVQRGADATQQAALQAGEARSGAQQAQQVMSDAVQRMQQADAGARRIHEAALLINRLASQTGVLALNAAAAASRAGAAGAEFSVVAHEVRALSVRCTEAAANVRAQIDDAVAHVQHGRRQVEQTGAAMSSIVAAAGTVAERLAALAVESQARARALSALGSTTSTLDAQTREGAARTARSGEAAQALLRRSTRLVQAVTAFRLAPAPGAMLADDADPTRHATGRRPLQPRRG